MSEDFEKAFALCETKNKKKKNSRHNQECNKFETGEKERRKKSVIEIQNQLEEILGRKYFINSGLFCVKSAQKIFLTSRKAEESVFPGKKEI